jgi:Icc-related predicted phosphoesterase
MRLLLFSDLHCDATSAKRLAELAEAEKVDFVVGAGDFANQRRGLRICLDILRNIERPTILVAGNNESTDELRAACADWPAATVLHGTAKTVQGTTFFGLAGGIPVTPFGTWSYDFSDTQATALLAECPRECILVTHSPPYGWVDVSSQGKNLGSSAIRDAVIRLRPKLVVCGHIHGSAGKDIRNEQTDIVNAGPAGVIWDLA